MSSFVQMPAPPLAWLAGLLDGEGSIGSTVRRNSKKYGRRYYITPAVQMSITCRETRDVAAKVLEEIGVRACGYGYTEKDPKRHRNAYHLRVIRLQDIEVAAQALLPFSVTKRKQWALILELVRSRLRVQEVGEDGRIKRGGVRHPPYTAREIEIAEALRELNLRGPAAVRRDRRWKTRLQSLGK